MSAGDGNVVSLEEFRERLEKLGEPVYRVKHRAATVHHLARTKTNALGTRVSTKALCGKSLPLGARWTRIVGKDPCCNTCQSIASRGRFVVRPLLR